MAPKSPLARSWVAYALDLTVLAVAALVFVLSFTFSVR